MSQDSLQCLIYIPIIVHGSRFVVFCCCLVFTNILRITPLTLAQHYDFPAELSLNGIYTCIMNQQELMTYQ